MPRTARLGVLGDLVTAAALLVGAYRLLLLAGARAWLRTEPGDGDRDLRFTVLIPAHDEADGIGATLAAVAALDHPADRVAVVAIADNCADRTAAVARAAGARVLERDDPQRAGKGQALAWGIEELAGELGDVLVLLDADCLPDPGFLRAVAAHVARGARAVQADYRVANPADGPRPALRYAGFLLQNTIRPAGRSALGWSAGLSGTGMAFTRELVERVGWSSFSFAEDREQHLRLVAAGERVVFAHRALIVSRMPTDAAATTAQELRWESGRGTLARGLAGRLLWQGLRRRDPVAVEAALDPVVPPQAAVAALNLAALAIAGVRGRRRAPALAAGLAQGAFVLGGLAVGGAPRPVYAALVRAPAFVVRRLGLLGRSARGGGPQQWVRTSRG